MSTTMTIKPRMSEKAYTSSQTNTYVFDVPLNASKAAIIAAIKAQFGVNAEDARMVVVKGKKKQSYRKGSRPAAGSRSDFKKAYVRLKKGDKIAIFEAQEKAEEKAEKTAATMKKAQDRAVQKETKKQGGLKGMFNRGQRQTQNRGGE